MDLSPLVPLRFHRLDEELSSMLEAAGIGVGEVQYGVGVYTSGCGRFQIRRLVDADEILSRGSDPLEARASGWSVDSVLYDDGWRAWLEEVGLRHHEASTRREALETLHLALSIDGLLEASAAPISL